MAGGDERPEAVSLCHASPLSKVVSGTEISATAVQRKTPGSDQDSF